ncbi:40S ribosomal protein S3a [Diplonema papillatum]|nr:40S ribosomal protein S3a [Diplonema papillatum]
MAVGKNKRLSKGGKRSQKRKVGDTMLGKEWYDVVAPSAFTVRQCAKTICNKSKGTALAADSLKGRIFEVCLGDLMSKGEENDDKVYKARNMRLKAEEVQGRSVLTNFYGMSMTTDALKVLFKKWVTLIEGHFECKTSDGYTLRLFAITFTRKSAEEQQQRNAHCQSSHVKKIRQKMGEIIMRTVTKSTLEKVVRNLQQEVMGKEINKACNSIYQLSDVNIRKVKVIKTPKADVTRLLEAHGGQDGIPKSVEGGRQKMVAAVVEETENAEAED